MGVILPSLSVLFSSRSVILHFPASSGPVDEGFQRSMLTNHDQDDGEGNWLYIHMVIRLSISYGSWR